MEESITESEEVKEVSQGVGLIMYVDITVTKRKRGSVLGRKTVSQGLNLPMGERE